MGLNGSEFCSFDVVSQPLSNVLQFSVIPGLISPSMVSLWSMCSGQSNRWWYVVSASAPWAWRQVSVNRFWFRSALWFLSLVYMRYLGLSLSITVVTWWLFLYRFDQLLELF